MSGTTPAHGAVLVVRLPAELRDALQARAATEDRSLASLLRLAARDYLQDGHK